MIEQSDFTRRYSHLPPVVQGVLSHRVTVRLTSISTPERYEPAKTYDFTPELCEDGRGYFIKWGSFSANFWFTTDGIGPNVGNHLYHVTARLRKIWAEGEITIGSNICEDSYWTRHMRSV